MRTGAAIAVAANHADGLSQVISVRSTAGRPEGLRYLALRASRKLRSARSGGVSVTMSEY